MKKRARDFSKLHHEDPSGFWKLVRTGKELPAVGDVILYVVDIRGTVNEAIHNIMVRISEGDPYKVTNDAIAAGKMRPNVETLMIAEVTKLPTRAAAPKTKIGTVSAVSFDPALDEWYITVLNCASDNIVYWAPMPTPPDTYTARNDEVEDLSFFENALRRDRGVFDYIDRRKLREQSTT